MVHQYSNGTGSLKYIITSEGRLLNTGTNAAPVWGWEYDLKDHLGNVRVIFKPNATNNGVVRVEYANYFPFGMKMLSPYSTYSGAKYLYNGKEYQDDFGLNWYDYGARMYDPMIGRWHSVDPKAELCRRWSPYSYCYNNPMRYIDPDGKVVLDVNARKNPNLVIWAKNLEKNYANKPESFRLAFKEYSGLTDNQIKSFVQYGHGPTLTVKNLDTEVKQRNGITLIGVVNGKWVNGNADGTVPETGGNGLITLDDDVVKKLEMAKTMKERKAGELLLESTLFHEGIHYGTATRKSNEDEYENQGKEKGKEFEISVYGNDIGRNNTDEIANPEIQPIKPIEITKIKK